MNIYISNLSGDVGDDDLRQAFETFGDVASVNVIKDKFSGESRGFGFVEMPSKEEALLAIKDLNGKDLKGQSLNVSEARPRPESRSGRGSFGGKKGGYGGNKGGFEGNKGGYGGSKGGYGGGFGGGGRRGNR